MERSEKLAVLSANFKALPEKDWSFAESLVSQSNSRGLSEKQWYWVERLCDRITGEDKVVEEVADFSGVYRLFNEAKVHLKYPKFVLHLPKGGNIKLYLSGGRSRLPGVVNVVEADTNAWFGRVYPDGKWENHRTCDRAVSGEVYKMLTRLAAAPEEVAAEHGKLTGICCFCSRKLSDDRSTEVGYGKTCAEHYGLKWGRK